ncbi:MAG: AbrB family transcriptional regulator [Gammaproteobacteria bacterium RIFCSPLOWO2_02_FULL_42_14]|nr:MAG: AbrB family transcriptional regulator [Gammaproteobacteria bacterium RIFCSPHIGHO2_02_FULL_42_43]OGT27664.1 MAG: AbrB family transcriptional regulator [Gammaproteobacteria bacterium RIFCSPHIGHO2_01_FULL_42_8]OGT52154.1 MAG: AbrB family transcriptional regulator [Gammaproteobacteria bacterium RIFCSPHIGHO2_12_FULL_41_25]OGT62592.1 MAG: AbrB family transcriptional regulator [Gammaproteobacteria bacterium RIFCSPLOWO2_02_FULL_42_14]OGT86574.1 MAG: AbrB family transcriptional regulator [Gammap
MNISKLTAKYQATIPAEVRESLNLHAGDKIGFYILRDKVCIVKIRPFDMAYHQALESTLSEWDSMEDDEAYHDL